MRDRNVIDFASRLKDRRLRRAAARPLCRHCGAFLSDGDNEDECSSFGLSATMAPSREAPLKFYAE